jgi:hypothetical protein
MNSKQVGFNDRLYKYIYDKLCENKECTLMDKDNVVVAYISYNPSDYSITIRDNKEATGATIISYREDRDSIAFAIKNILFNRIPKLMDLHSVVSKMCDELILSEIEFIEKIIREEDYYTYKIELDKQYFDLNTFYYPKFDITLINQHTCGILIRSTDKYGFIHKYRINSEEYKKLIESEYNTKYFNPITEKLATEIYFYVKNYTEKHHDDLDKVGKDLKEFLNGML